jgi:hypothetical protein
LAIFGKSHFFDQKSLKLFNLVKTHRNSLHFFCIIGREKYPMSILVWLGLTIHGPIVYFIEPGEKLNGSNYSRRILSFAKREGNRLFGGTNWVFQQDGAPAHTSGVDAQRWCSENLKYFLPKDKWPPNSTDLNPLDFYFWDAVVTRMNEMDPFTTTLDIFREEIERAIFSVPLEEIRKAIGSVTKRFRKVEQNGGKTYND